MVVDWQASPGEEAVQDLIEDESAVLSETESRVIDMGADQHGERLDKALADRVPEFSRSYLRQLLEHGAVQLNGQPFFKVAQKVKAGDRVVLEMRPTLESQAFKPEPMALEVVYEDDHLLVVNKPAGLVVHPAPGNWSGTLLNGLMARDAKCAQMPRAGIVHRLDKDTSGLMVVARTRAAMDALVHMIAQRQVHRQYLALAHRPWQGGEAISVDVPIGRDPRNRLRMAVVDLAMHAGKSARTDVELLARGAQVCWVRCTLHTGRTHQIRVHMAFKGHPLVADALYGGTPLAGMQRQALHAFRLAFKHPVTDDALEFLAPVPGDMRSALDVLGLGYNNA